jgi:histidyl-tRNA synthetase
VKIEAPRGTGDVLPADQGAREAIVRAAEGAALRYGFGRITIPTFEDTQLFARTSGEGSDVVTKEMYTFEDRAGRSLTLRPEATAGIARAYLEHGLHRQPQPVKTFMVGPMFRYAAPQKGRYREFWQVNFEAIGSDDPALDAELVQLFVEIARALGIDGLRLELNSIGDRDCRPAYIERLREFLAEHDSELDDDARRKAEVSPLRVFDSKEVAVRRVLASAPTIGESLCAACREHFGEVCSYLDAYGVAYELAPTLVRGLDYYTRTVFEFVKDDLGAAQSTICAGGRYDYLIEEIGGGATPGIGWAAGIERMAMSTTISSTAPSIDAFFAYDDGVSRAELLAQMTALRQDGYSCDAEYAGRSERGQLTQAKRLGARVVVHGSAAGALVVPAGERPASDRQPVPVTRIAEEVRGILGEPQ